MSKQPNDLEINDLDSMIEGMLLEVDRAKAERKKAGVPQAAETVAEQPWVLQAVVGVFAAVTCKNCHETHITPHSKEPLLRYVHKHQPNTIWESSTPIGVVPHNLPRVRKLLPRECDYCNNCFDFLGHMEE